MRSLTRHASAVSVAKLAPVLVLLLPPLLLAQSQDGRLDLSAGTQFIGSLLGAVQAWFPWILFLAFLVCLCGAGFHSRRRMEWMGGGAGCLVVGLLYLIGKLYITKVTGVTFS